MELVVSAQLPPCKFLKNVPLPPSLYLSGLVVCCNFIFHSLACCLNRAKTNDFRVNVEVIGTWLSPNLFSNTLEL